MMFCCVTPQYEKLKESTDTLVVSPLHTGQPAKSYMPLFSEHRVQLEPQSYLDDPSDIFYDPDEKPGFVYRSLDREDTFAYEPFEQSTPATTPKKGNIHRSGPEMARLESPLTSEFDDSLDELPHIDSMNEASFDDLGLDAKLVSHSNRLRSDKEQGDLSMEIDGTDEHIRVNEQKLQEGNLQYIEEDVSNHLANLRFYEDSGYSSGGHRHLNKRDNYNSDAESSKTYQDSGIYEDDVFIDSPRHPIDLKVQDDFRGDNHFGFVDRMVDPPERLTAFKTPNSSRQNSEESDISYSPIKVPGKVQKDRTTQVLAGTKTSSKYNHVQPKVQTRRIIGETATRSENSTFVKAGRNSTDQNGKMAEMGRTLSEKKRTGIKTPAKAKVGSLENIGHVPGGGDTKIFRQKLNFRSKAVPRTDTHGIEMFSHLPEEFQEIARRLARQDREIKGNERRGRVRSRSTSTVASSRTSSVSPARGRSQNRKKNATPKRELVFPEKNMDLSDEVRQITSPSKQSENLSRSSSVRSIPSTPSLSRHHPATASTLYDKRSRSKSSPMTSRSQSPIIHRPKPGSRSTSPVLSRSRSRSKSRSRPGTPKGGSRTASPISQLYQYSQSELIPPSPRLQGASAVFHFVPVR